MMDAVLVIVLFPHDPDRFVRSRCDWVELKVGGRPPVKIRFEALPTEDVRRIRNGGADSYGNPVELHRAVEDVYPCRHCLGTIAPGEDYLVLAYRPFAGNNPYAKTGPIFLCATDCDRAPVTDRTPPILRAPDYIVRGYSAAERIVYGTGQVTPTEEIAAYAGVLLTKPDVAFVDVRSARNNCFQCRIFPAS